MFHTMGSIVDSWGCERGSAGCVRRRPDLREDEADESLGITVQFDVARRGR